MDAEIQKRASQIKSFEDLIIWQNAFEISVAVFNMVERKEFKNEKFRKEEICEDALGISSDIAKGYQLSHKEFLNCLLRSRRNVSSLKNKIDELAKLIATGLNLDDLIEKLEELSGQIDSFVKLYESNELGEDDNPIEQKYKSVI